MINICMCFTVREPVLVLRSSLSFLRQLFEQRRRTAQVRGGVVHLAELRLGKGEEFYTYRIYIIIILVV